MKTLGFIISVKNMRYKIVCTVWLLLCKNCAGKDDVMHENIRCSCLWDDRYVG